jgi:hypothetical protein
MMILGAAYAQGWQPVPGYGTGKTTIDSAVTISGVGGHLLGARGTAESNGLGLYIFEAIVQKDVQQEAQETPLMVILDATALDPCQTGMSLVGSNSSVDQNIQLTQGVRGVDTMRIPSGALSQCQAIQLSIHCVFQQAPASPVTARIAVHSIRFVYATRTVTIEDATGGEPPADTSGVHEAHDWKFMMAYATTIDSSKTYSAYDESTKTGSFYQEGTGKPANTGYYLTSQWGKYFPYRAVPDSITVDVQVSYKGGSLTSAGLSLGLHADQSAFINPLQIFFNKQGYQHLGFATNGKIPSFGALSFVFYLNASDANMLGFGVQVRNLKAVYPDSTILLDFGSSSTGVAVTENGSRSPASFALMQNYPNPFNPSTRVLYSIPEAGNVDLALYDMLGRQIAVLVRGAQSAGTHEAVIDAQKLDIPSGVYIYSLRAGKFTQSRKMILLK